MTRCLVLTRRLILAWCLVLARRLVLTRRLVLARCLILARCLVLARRVVARAARMRSDCPPPLRGRPSRRGSRGPSRRTSRLPSRLRSRFRSRSAAAAIAVVSRVAMLRWALGWVLAALGAAWVRALPIAKQPTPEPDQRAYLRRRGRRGLRRRCGHRHRHDGRGGRGQDAGNQRHVARRLLVAIANVGVIDARLIRQLIADGGVFRQFLLVVAYPAQGYRPAFACEDSARSPAIPCRAIRFD